jgi:uncharacterized phage protein (TIGR02218 family)
MLAWYAGGAITATTCWKATLTNGTVIAATKLDRDLVVDGVTYASTTGYIDSNVESSSELNPDNLEVDGFLQSPAITDADIHNGLWDFAKIELFEVNYLDLTMGKNVLRSGTLGEVKGGRIKFTAELRGLMQAWTKTIVRLTTKNCIADLGDSKCKINLASFTITGAVTSVSANRIVGDTSRTEAAEWFTGGKITFTSGANTGRSMEVKHYTVGSIELHEALYDPIAVGDTYSMYAGCTKRFTEDCKVKFNNAVNFRGFPHLPGSAIYRVGGVNYGPTITAGTVGTGGGTGGGGGGGTRDKLVQPFASDSIWNMPIGSGAVYVPAGMNGNPGSNAYAHMPGVDAEHIVMSPTSPLVDIRYSSAAWTGADRCPASSSTVLATVPIPNGYNVPSGNTNSGAAFLAADGRTVVQVEPLARCVGQPYGTAFVRAPDVDIYGAGIRGAHGGSGLSSLGGSIRLGELRPGQTGPKHALKVNVYAKQFLYRGSSSADCYRWPATTCDSYAVGFYGTDGSGGPSAMKMGALLAIPATTSIASLALETDPGAQIAWTLQNYGAYIVDDAYAPGFDFSAEDGPTGSKAAEFLADYGYAMQQQVNQSSTNAWVRDIQKICAALYVVDNNSASSIGGGGTPLQPLAPPLA